MSHYKQRIRGELSAVYSQDLINNLFRHPYTKIDFVVEELGTTRKTAAKYLDSIVELGLLSKHKLGRENFYLNDALFELLSDVGNVDFEKRG